VDWDLAPTAERLATVPVAGPTVSLPHGVAELSWDGWNPAAWQALWFYRRIVDLPTLECRRILLDVEFATTGATVTCNGVVIGRHAGGYLPFVVELTGAAHAGANEIGILVDGRFNQNVPPNIPIPAPPQSIDFWQPAGLGRVRLQVRPPAFLARLEVHQEAVLDAEHRRLIVTCVIDSGAATAGQLEVRLIDSAGAVVALCGCEVAAAAGISAHRLVLRDLADTVLWDVDNPVLYTVEADLTTAEGVSAVERRIGLREARFAQDGFFLNGRRRYLFGANRHQHFPYTGFAMPDRVQRKDAELLRHDLNCLMVRCSHYPQSSAFLDACDELGLLVWEEAPGWQFVGDKEWRECFLVDVRDMIIRDGHRPSVVVWGVRLNETPDRPALWDEAERIAKSLDPCRATSGTIAEAYHDTEHFAHDVFAYDDYAALTMPGGDRLPTLLPPRPGRPYLVAEAVTTWCSPTKLYRRREAASVQQHQAMDHARVHELALRDKRYAGVLVWSAVDYQSGHVVHHRGMKTSGLLDTFRIPKPGAAMYRAQTKSHHCVEPAFTWDPPTEADWDGCWTPGRYAVVFTTCERIEVWVGGVLRAVVTPDRSAFGSLIGPPALVDLRVQPGERPDLELRGMVGDEAVVIRRFSGDPHSDRLVVKADDNEIVADGVDATRVVFAVVDRFGEARGSSSGAVQIRVEGPGALIGDPLLDLAETGGVGAVWVKARTEPGVATIHVEHNRFGSARAAVTIRPREIASE
jgi:beta-galactosidase